MYQKAYALAMEIFRLSKGWPPEEKYSLTDQNEDRPVVSARTYVKDGRRGDTKRISLSVNIDETLTPPEFIVEEGGESS